MNRRELMRSLGIGAVSLASPWLALRGVHAAASASKPNVLFIAVDDLNHWVGYTGRNPQTKTPNIDRLSKLGVSFTRAYCAAPVCNPSRAALMSGLRPGASGVYGNNDNWREFIPEGIGLAATFKKAGYYVAGAGKIYHSSTYYPGEWDDYFEEKGFGSEEDEDGNKAKNKGGNKDKAKAISFAGAEPGAAARVAGIQKDEAYHIPLAHDLRDSDLSDYHITNYCIEQLGRQQDRPFFLACGLHRPHLPWVVPKKYYELFPLETIELPPYKEDDLSDLPPEGVKMAREAEHKQFLAEGRWKDAVQSYLASIAYTDMNLGRLLDALEQSAYAKNTIICFWGDHGWHLGEKHHWRKFALWEEATRAPFIWFAPGVSQAGALCERTVDFMCIYPTLCELAGIEAPKHVEGVSIRRLLEDPKAPWDIPAVTTHGYMNHAVRSEAYRYIRYQNGGEEFYDEAKDPYEWTNRADSPELAPQKAQLAKFLPTQNIAPRATKAAKEKPVATKDKPAAGDVKESTARPDRKSKKAKE